MKILTIKEDGGKQVIVSEKWIENGFVVKEIDRYDDGTTALVVNYDSTVKFSNADNYNIDFPIKDLHKIDLYKLSYASFDEHGNVIGFISTLNNVKITYDIEDDSQVIQKRRILIDGMWVLHNDNGPAFIVSKNGKVAEEYYYLKGQSVDKVNSSKEAACPTCGKMNDVGVNECWNCGRML